MSTERQTETVLENTRVNIRILLAAFWICHFLLWTFGDMLSLLQKTAEPVTATIVLVVAPTLAITQTLMVVFSLRGEPKFVRLVNLIVTPVYLLFNIGYLVEPGNEVWNYLLGLAYILFNILIIWHAWKWPKQEA